MKSIHYMAVCSLFLSGLTTYGMENTGNSESHSPSAMHQSITPEQFALYAFKKDVSVLTAQNDKAPLFISNYIQMTLDRNTHDCVVHRTDTPTIVDYINRQGLNLSTANTPACTLEAISKMGNISFDLAELCINRATFTWHQEQLKIKLA